ncbi:MAG: hypothetical protein WA885_07660 [Phormidesmis sp.]
MTTGIDDGFGEPNQDLVLEPGQDLVLRNFAGTEVMRLDADNGIIRLRNGEPETVIQIQASTGNLLVGAPGADGDLWLFPASAQSQDTDFATIHLNADSRSVRVGDSERPGIVRVRGSGEQIDIDGGAGAVIASGRVEVRTAGGRLRAQLSESGNAILGGSDARGRLEIRNAESAGTVVFNGELGHGRMGGEGAASMLEMRRADGTVTIVLNGETGNVGLGAPGGGEGGALFVKDTTGTDTFTLNGNTGEARFGSTGNAGLLAIRDGNGQETVVLNGAAGNVGLGRFGTPGDLFLTNDQGQNTIHLSGGTGNINLVGDQGQNTIHLSGSTGNINLVGDVRFTNNVADFAEEFDLVDLGAACAPGTVLSIVAAGKLTPSCTAYDSRVAGVVSGAGGLRPGVILGEDRVAVPGTRCHLAVLGRVYVKADADLGAIAVGDLLTTSTVPGHAMRVVDRTRAVGAVIGKSLGALERGRGYVEMLISLQ